jgi:exosortase A-associated hydrolase 1
VIGVITVVAGGPQYRAGMGRGLVGMGRELAARGIPLMRFDHRGLGDSSGDFLGFEHLKDDLCAAVDSFMAAVPEVKKIVLWGGCDAASGIMIHACNVPSVVSMMVGNPFVSSSVTQAAVARQHYLKRLGEWSFWRKLLRFEYDFIAYGSAVAAKVKKKLTPVAVQRVASQPSSVAATFIDRMLSGLQKFNGPVLILMSGQSLVSKEFDELLARSPAWKAACGRAGYERIELPDADQAFSSQDAKERVNEAVFRWINELAQN